MRQNKTKMKTKLHESKMHNHGPKVQHINFDKHTMRETKESKEEEKGRHIKKKKKQIGDQT